MSVRMALAKLCACACGGAIVGGDGNVTILGDRRDREAFEARMQRESFDAAIAHHLAFAAQRSIHSHRPSP